MFSDGNPENQKSAKLRSLRQDPNGRMATFYGTRSSLSNLAIKFDYCNSGVHCIPRDLSPEKIHELFPFPDCDIPNLGSVWRAILKEAENTTVRNSAHIK